MTTSENRGSLLGLVYMDKSIIHNVTGRKTDEVLY
jgi:hypothetical protein